jgi:hypothetical protein
LQFLLLCTYFLLPSLANDHESSKPKISSSSPIYVCFIFVDTLSVVIELVHINILHMTIASCHVPERFYNEIVITCIGNQRPKSFKLLLV